MVQKWKVFSRKKARWDVGIMNTKAIESDNKKETLRKRSPGLPPQWRLGMIDRVHSKASIGPVNAMVVAGVIHSCSREVIGVNIIRPIGIDVWHRSAEKQRRWWHRPHGLWMVIKPWMVGGEIWHRERMKCERVVGGTRLRVRYVFFIFGRRLVCFLFACSLSSPPCTFLFSRFAYMNLTFAFNLGFARGAKRNNSFVRGPTGLFSGRVCLLLGGLCRCTILAISTVDGMWSVVQVVVAVLLYMGCILGPISSAYYRLDRP